VRAGAMVSGGPGEKPRRREGGLPHGWFIPRAVRAGKSGGLGRGGVVDQVGNPGSRTNRKDTSV
jgi:hypothetical protein